MPMPLILGSSDNIAERKKETCVALLPLSSDQVLKIKNKANEETAVSSLVRATRPYSRYEAITAHIWRSGNKARNHDKQQPTIVRFLGDTRNRLKPPLPRNYFGNAVARMLTPMCSSGEIISNPLGYAPRKYKKELTRLQRSTRDFGWGKPLYMGPGILNEDGKTFILPSPSEDGSVIIALRFQTAHMEAFQKFFYEDI
ncbi:hypothetical protein L6164_001016 [Bauhinia variegata]|uniref:Uncharacterized protein n=1 Tax=Bauhinia variegata TaxID=167791 RepID=A0ACB9Q885_BAUVA|nr:hypothetical protein L6164_001016 [Bauhinia variegata]